MKALLSAVRAFAQEEDGVALTEYLILLGLLVGGVTLTVQAAGGALNTTWATWEAFFADPAMQSPI